MPRCSCNGTNASIDRGVQHLTLRGINYLQETPWLPVQANKLIRRFKYTRVVHMCRHTRWPRRPPRSGHNAPVHAHAHAHTHAHAHAHAHTYAHAHIHAHAHAHAHAPTCGFRVQGFHTHTHTPGLGPPLQAILAPFTGMGGTCIFSSHCVVLERMQFVLAHYFS